MSERISRAAVASMLASRLRAERRLARFYHKRDPNVAGVYRLSAEETIRNASSLGVLDDVLERSHLPAEEADDLRLLLTASIRASGR